MRTPVHTPVLIALAVMGGLAACADDGDTGALVSAPSSDTVATTPVEPAVTEPAVTEPAVTEPAVTEPAVTESTVDPSAVAVAIVDGLDPDEVAGLLWMREEEQLAHDVYTVLGEQWDLRVFENIAGSEATHIEATIDLLDRYGIADPAADNEPGTFTDPTIQQLYDDLVAQGSQSLEDALLVGVAIEELDIADLRVRAESTDESAIDDVYARLERGSRNHLRAFAGQLDLLGVDVEATVLDDFEAIVSSPIERGRDGH